MPPLPPPLPTVLGESGERCCAHMGGGFKGSYQPALSPQAAPARVPTHVLGDGSPLEQIIDTWDLLCPLGWFRCRGGRKGGLIQGFINLTVDCNRSLSYIGTVSGNRLRRGRRRWVTATLLLLPALLPSAKAQKHGAAHVGLASSSGLVKLHVGKEKAKLDHGHLT